MGASRLTCEENGDWSSSPPSCQFIGKNHIDKNSGVQSVRFDEF